MEVQKHRKLVQHYNKFGVDETVKFILYSEEKKYLKATNDISKVLELVTLSKGQRSIVKYLNYLEDKKRTIMPSYSTTYNSKIVEKLSLRQLKYMKSNIDKIPSNKLVHLKSFVGVLELNQDDLSLKRVKAKVRKINALYTAIIPLCNIDFLKVIEALELKGIECSEQDIIAFLSLVVALSYDGVNVNIPASFWESIFGRKHIKVAKQVFQDVGILKFRSKPIRGFKSVGYKIKLCDDDFSDDASINIFLPITSIRTLEKLNRIKRYRGNFTLYEKIEALELIKELRLQEIKLARRKINYTTIFLESGKLQMLIDDLNRMIDIMNDNKYYDQALSLGTHLTTYSNNIKEHIYKDYRPLY